MQLCHCTIVSVENFTPTIWRVRLAPQTPVTYTSGQYLQILLGSDDKRAFSIANAATVTNDILELHIGAEPAQPYTWDVIHYLHTHKTVTIEQPNGNAYLRTESDKPVLCVVGGTGFSYAHAVLEDLAAQKSKRTLQLYWGVRTSDAFYTDKPVQDWPCILESFQYDPIVEFPDDAWTGRTGRLIDAVLQDHISLAHYDIYIAGRFEMAGAARKAFIDKGADPKHIFGDAFSVV